MDFGEVVRRRRMVRAFRPDAIAPDVVDVYAALRNQFYWADRVIVTPAAAEPEVLEGEIVGLTD